MVSTTPHHESKAKLLDAALHVIRAKGYAATTIDDICAAAKLTKGSFFHHFKSKDELALAAADYFAEMAKGLFKSAPYHTPDDPLDRVLGYLDFRAAILKGDLPEFTCLLGTLVQETYQTHPALRAACEKHMIEHAGEVAKDIAEARRLHAPHSLSSPESLAMFTQAVLQGAFILAKATEGPEVAVECIAHLRRYLHSQLQPAPDTKKDAKKGNTHVGNPE